MDSAIIDFEQKLGVRPVSGGYHKTFGTKNALINLNSGIYLELLAADDSNLEILTPRWMGVDFLTKNQITRWALKSDRLDKDGLILKTHHPMMGNIRRGSRATPEGSSLQWQLIMPLAAPEVELIPFAVDWSATEKHPSEILPNMGCNFIKLYGTHPRPNQITAVLKELHFDLNIKKAKEISLKLVIDSPNGRVEI